MDSYNYYRPRRVLSFVPSSVLNSTHEPLYIFAQKCLLGRTKRANIPDCLIFDLEDSVPMAYKSPSIEWLGSFIEKHSNHTGVELVLRVNAQKDLPRFGEEFVLARQLGFDAIMLPKVDRSNFADLLQRSLENVKLVIPIIETVRGYADKDDILLYGKNGFFSSEDAQPYENVKDKNKTIPAVAMGLDDFSSDMRLPRDHFFLEPGFTSFVTGLAYSARRFGAMAIGPVYNHIKDHQGLIQETERLKNMGYRGSLCVFPPHVRFIKSIYTPSELEVDKAHQILVNLDKAGQEGKGWIFFEDVKYDTADIQGLEWLIEYAALCGQFDAKE